MIPYTFDPGPVPLKTYKDFQAYSSEDREAALRFLMGQHDRHKINKKLITSNTAANDDWSRDTMIIVSRHECCMMLYCWVENNRDDVQAKLAYVEGRLYGP